MRNGTVGCATSFLFGGPAIQTTEPKDTGGSPVRITGIPAVTRRRATTGGQDCSIDHSLTARAASPGPRAFTHGGCRPCTHYSHRAGAVFFLGFAIYARSDFRVTRFATRASPLYASRQRLALEMLKP